MINWKGKSFGWEEEEHENVRTTTASFAPPDVQHIPYIRLRSHSLLTSAASEKFPQKFYYNGLRVSERINTTSGDDEKINFCRKNDENI